MTAIPAVVLIPWPQIAERVQTIRIPQLAVIGQVEIGKIDFTYEVLDEFQDWYEARTGSHLEDLSPELIEKIQAYVYSILTAHWDPAKITAALWTPQETIDSLPPGTIDNITKRDDGAVFWLGPNFIGTYNKLASEPSMDTEYLLSIEETQPDEVIFLLNQLGPQIDIDTEGWGSNIPELDFVEIAQIIENELLAEDAPPYYTEAHRQFTPKHAWELPLAEVIEVLYSDDVRARRPLLLDLWPEFVVQIPSGSPDPLHSLIYHEYHTGERGHLNPKIVDEADVAKRHQRIQEKMKPKLEAKRMVAGRRRSVGVIPRLRPVGRSRLGMGELTLIRLSESTTQQVRKNHPEVVEKLEQPIERLSEECIITLLQARVDILDIVENAAKMISKKAR